MLLLAKLLLFQLLASLFLHLAFSQTLANFSFWLVFCYFLIVISCFYSSFQLMATVQQILVFKQSFVTFSCQPNLYHFKLKMVFCYFQLICLLLTAFSYPFIHLAYRLLLLPSFSFVLLVLAFSWSFATFGFQGFALNFQSNFCYVHLLAGIQLILAPSQLLLPLACHLHCVSFQLLLFQLAICYFLLLASFLILLAMLLKLLASVLLLQLEQLIFSFFNKFK